MAATWFALALIMVVVAPLGFFLLLILLTFLKDLMSGRDSDRLTKAEAQQFQRMCHSLDRMEERMANLETILKSREPEAPQDLREKAG